MSEHTAARPKGLRAEQDQPAREPMRGNRRVTKAPSTDQKKVRRAINRKAHSIDPDDHPGAAITSVCKQCGEPVTLNRERDAWIDKDGSPLGEGPYNDPHSGLSMSRHPHDGWTTAAKTAHEGDDNYGHVHLHDVAPQARCRSCGDPLVQLSSGWADHSGDDECPETGGRHLPGPTRREGEYAEHTRDYPVGFYHEAAEKTANDARRETLAKHLVDQHGVEVSPQTSLEVLVAQHNDIQPHEHIKTSASQKTATELPVEAWKLNPGDYIRGPNNQVVQVRNVRRHKTNMDQVYVDTEAGTVAVPQWQNFTMVPGGRSNRQQELPKGLGLPGGNSNVLPGAPNAGGMSPGESHGGHKCPIDGSNMQLRNQGGNSVYVCPQDGYSMPAANFGFGPPGGGGVTTDPNALNSLAALAATEYVLNHDICAGCGQNKRVIPLGLGARGTPICRDCYHGLLSDTGASPQEHQAVDDRFDKYHPLVRHLFEGDGTYTPREAMQTEAEKTTLRCDHCGHTTDRTTGWEGTAEGDSCFSCKQGTMRKTSALDDTPALDCKVCGGRLRTDSGQHAASGSYTASCEDCGTQHQIQHKARTAAQQSPKPIKGPCPECGGSKRGDDGPCAFCEGRGWVLHTMASTAASNLVCRECGKPVHRDTAPYLGKGNNIWTSWEHDDGSTDHPVSTMPGPGAKTAYDVRPEVTTCAGCGDTLRLTGWGQRSYVSDSAGPRSRTCPSGGPHQPVQQQPATPFKWKAQPSDQAKSARQYFYSLDCNLDKGTCPGTADMPGHRNEPCACRCHSDTDGSPEAVKQYHEKRRQISQSRPTQSSDEGSIVGSWDDPLPKRFTSSYDPPTGSAIARRAQAVLAQEEQQS